MLHNAINVPVPPMWRRKGPDAAAKASAGRAGSAASSPRASTFGAGRLEWRSVSRVTHAVAVPQPTCNEHALAPIWLSPG